VGLNPPPTVLLPPAFFNEITSIIESLETFMQAVKKVEIIISHSYIEDTLKILDSLGVSGYTVLENTSGKGDRGFSCDDIDCNYSGSYIMTVCTNDKQLDTLVTKMKPLLKKVGGICVITDAQWLRH
jgi:nitrogen regulatory protein PII